MVINKKLGLWVLSCFVLLANVSRSQAWEVNDTLPETLGFSWEQKSEETAAAINVDVIDEYTGIPINDADVQIEGSSLKNVTVSRSGYSKFTIMGLQRAGHLTVFLKPNEAFGTGAVASGKLNEYAPGWTKHVDAGLILRSLGISDLIAFNAESMMSPLKDTINVVGARKIPSNLVFPPQKVNLFVSLNKPNFRMPMSVGRHMRLMAFQTAMLTNQLLDLPSDPMAVDLVNLLKNRKIGWSERLSPKGDFKQDFTLTHNLVEKYEVEAAAPPFEADLFAISALDLSSDRQELIPADLKAAKRGTYSRIRGAKFKLKAPETMPAGSEQQLLIAALADKGSRVSAALIDKPTAKSKVPEFLNIQQLPKSKQLPDQLVVKPLQKGMTFVMVMGNSLDAYQIVVLPTQKETTLNLRKLAGDVPAKSYSVTDLEFTESFIPSKIDGVKEVIGLRRFAFTKSTLGRSQNE